MAAPTKLPLWGDTSSNITEPDATQKHAGWGNEQDAVSSYFNWWMYTVYLWIAWLTGSRLRYVPASAGTMRTWANARANGVGYSPTVGDPFVLPIVLSEGEQLTAVSVPIFVFTTSVLTLKVFKYDAVSLTTTQLGATQTSGATGAGTLTVSGLTETGGSSGQVFYNAMVELSSGTLNSYALGAILTVASPHS